MHLSGFLLFLQENLSGKLACCLRPVQRSLPRQAAKQIRRISLGAIDQRVGADSHQTE
jgi:hypothetical protein